VDFAGIRAADSPTPASRGRKYALRASGGGPDGWQARVVGGAANKSVKPVRARGAAAWLRTWSGDLRAASD